MIKPLDPKKIEALFAETHGGFEVRQDIGDGCIYFKLDKSNHYEANFGTSWFGVFEHFRCNVTAKTALQLVDRINAILATLGWLDNS